MLAPPLDLGFAGYAVASSPFLPGRWAVATAANFGIVGNGRLHVVQSAPRADGSSGLQPVCAFDTNSGVYDCAWGEQSETQLLGACADGTVKLWDLAAATGGRPVMAFCEHTKDANSVDWNLQLKDSFASASWDGTVKVWRPERPHSLLTFAEHSYVVYECRWAPHHPTRLLSASGDHTVKLWDPGAGANSQMTFACGGCEVLSVDWSKYDPHVFATGGVDKAICTWDIRFPSRPVRSLSCHTYAVRRVRFSPHVPSLLVSASYDMSVCLWDVAATAQSPAPAVGLLRQYNHHTEWAAARHGRE